MIKHMTFTEHHITAANVQKQQEVLRDKAALFVNEQIGNLRVININEYFLPEAELFSITIWYEQLVDSAAEDKLLPEERSAELLERKIREVKREAVDLLVDERMVQGPG